MKNSKIKIIALDMDGTLLDGSGVLTETNRIALEKAMTLGIHFVVATGRVFSALPKDVLELSGLEYAITSNGANVVDLRTGKTIYSNLIGAENVLRVVERMKEEDMMMEIFFHGDVYTQRKCLENLEHYGIVTERSKTYTLKTRKPTDDIFGMMRQYADAMENINLIFADMDKKRRYYEELQQWPGITATSSFHHNLEIGGATTSKADGLAHLCGMLGIGREQVMAAGDMENDLAMLEFAGTAVAMENAVDSVKNAADFITKRNDMDGVAYAIERLVFNGLSE